MDAALKQNDCNVVGVWAAEVCGEGRGRGLRRGAGEQGGWVGGWGMGLQGGVGWALVKEMLGGDGEVVGGGLMKCVG